jgi:hypothetical protein
MSEKTYISEIVIARNVINFNPKFKIFWQFQNNWPWINALIQYNFWAFVFNLQMQKANEGCIITGRGYFGFRKIGCGACGHV